MQGLDLSVVLPVYGEDACLEECLARIHSVLRDCDLSFECVVVRARIAVAGSAMIQTKEGVEVTAAVGMPLREGDTLVLFSSGQAREPTTLRWENGATIEVGVALAKTRVIMTKVKIGARPPTQLEVLEGRVKEGATVGYIELQGGALRYIGPRPPPVERFGRFEIRQQSVVVAVMLTTFYVASDPQTQISTVGVEEGSVLVTPANPALTSLTLEAGQQVEVSPNSVSPITPIGSGPTPTPPPSGGGSSLKSFDKNNNNRIDDDEFFAIIDAWIAGQIDDQTFFQATDLWISQASISSAGVHPATLTAHSRGHAVTFTAHGQGIAALGIEIFDLNGRRIYTQEAYGRELIWNLRTDDGRVAANGVYFYAVKVRGTKGEILTSEVKKLMVLR